MVGGPARNRGATRERILRSAEREFANRGFQGARLRQIAAGAMTSVPLVIHHFSDKQGLYRAVVERLVGKVAAIGSRTAGAPASAGLLEGLSALAGLDPEGLVLLHQVLASGADGFEETVTPLRAVRERVVRQLRKAKRAGGLPRRADPELLTIALVGALLYPALGAPAIRAVWNHEPAPLQWRQRLARQVSLLLEGVTALSGEQPPRR